LVQTALIYQENLHQGRQGTHPGAVSHVGSTNGEFGSRLVFGVCYSREGEAPAGRPVAVAVIRVSRNRSPSRSWWMCLSSLLSWMSIDSAPAVRAIRRTLSVAFDCAISMASCNLLKYMGSSSLCTTNWPCTGCVTVTWARWTTLPITAPNAFATAARSGRQSSTPKCSAASGKNVAAGAPTATTG